MKNYLDAPDPIQINPDHAGKFTEWCHRHGFKSVQAGASHVLANKDHYSPEVVRMANFAHNASKWKHASGPRDDDREDEDET